MNMSYKRRITMNRKNIAQSALRVLASSVNSTDEGIYQAVLRHQN